MIRLAFTRGAGLTGTVVRNATWSKVAHVGLMIDDQHVIDAWPAGGVQERTLPAGARVYRVDAPVRASCVIAAARSQIGKPYDWSAIFGWAFHQRWANRDKWFCSELVAWCFQQAGCPLLRADDLSRITPRDLLLSPYLQEVTP